MKEGFSGTIPIKTGVKQGDLLSPLLSNLALDPLLHMLEKIGGGVKLGEQVIASLAFANDLVLLSESEEGMRRNLRIPESFSDLTGLKANPSKCQGFLIKKSRNGLRINNGMPWTLHG